jgi:ElaB/YqjD/DUF883 family membrane-anchored ribosome-binding protein
MNTDQISRSNNPAGSAAGFDTQGTRSGSQGASSGSQDMRGKAGETVSKVAEAAQQVGNQAKQAAASLASEANQKAKGMLNQQVAVGADLVGHVADSAKTAADSLEQKAPQLAGLVRNAADRIEDFSRDIRGQSVDELIKAASNFTRRQPALVFGLASIAGFMLFRVLKSSPPGQARTGRDTRERFGGSIDERFGEQFANRSGERVGASASQFHGV